MKIIINNITLVVELFLKKIQFLVPQTSSIVEE